jgi:putative salt-induced outer membrane protein YdiY
MFASALLVAMAAHAEDSEFAGTVAAATDEPPKTESHVSAALGGTYTSGNSTFYSLTALAKADHLWAVRNKVSGEIGAQLGGSKSDVDGDGHLNEEERQGPLEEDVRRLSGELRYDRLVSDHDAFYALAGAFHDPFGGYDVRAHEQVGYSRLLVSTEDTKFRTELGFDWAQEDYVDDIDPNYADVFAGRILLGLDHKFNENVGFGDVFEVYESLTDFEDVRILNTATFSSKLTTVFSLNLSHVLVWDNIPVEGFAELDQTVMATVVATIL